MDCRKAWDLMMKSFDNEISKQHRKELNMHISECDECKTMSDNLTEAFTFMDTSDWQAPADIEKRVMAKLNLTKHRRDFLMPYVICNLIVFTGIVASWLDSVFKIGIFTFIKEVFNEVVAAYNMSATVFTAFRNFFSTYFIKPTINIAIIAFLIYGLLSIISILQKMLRRYVSVR
jgi:hypothetical protein